MIRVLYIVSTLKLSGPSNQLYNIIKNLDRKHFEPFIITLSKEPERSRMSDFIEMNIKIHSLKLSRLVGFILINTKIRKILSQIKPDIIHTQGIRADILSGLRLSKKYKTVATLRNYPFDDYPMTYGKLPGRLMARIHLFVLARIHGPVVVSNSISQRLKKERNLELTPIQNGVDENKFYLVNNTKRMSLREELGLPKDKILLVSVGHLSSRKNSKMIIEAFQRLESANDLVLIFLGTGKLEQSCKNMIQFGDQIKFLGKINNVDQYLKAADCFISSSKSEGLPNSVLEAIACGLPVLLSNIPPHVEIFEDYHCPFPFFDVFEIDELVAILENLTRDKLNESRDFFMKVFAENFTANIMSNKYQTLYNKLLKQH